MSLYSYILIPILSLFFTVVDTSYFSFYEIFGATIISSFCVVVILSILGYRKFALLFAAWSILFLSIFSSLPLYTLFAAFLGVPLLILYLKGKVYYESSLLAAISIFILANFVFRLLLLPVTGPLTNASLWSVIFFPLLNTIFCIILFVVIKKIASYFKA